MKILYWKKEPASLYCFIAIDDKFDTNLATELIQTAKGGEIVEINQKTTKEQMPIIRPIDIYNFIKPSDILSLSENKIKTFEPLFDDWKKTCVSYERDVLDNILNL